MDELITKLKGHIEWEEGMDETMLSFYIQNAQRYVQKATGTQSEYLVVMVSAIMYEYRVSEKQLKEALDAITPFIVQEVFSGAETSNE